MAACEGESKDNTASDSETAALFYNFSTGSPTSGFDPENFSLGNGGAECRGCEENDAVLSATNSAAREVGAVNAIRWENHVVVEDADSNGASPALVAHDGSRPVVLNDILPPAGSPAEEFTTSPRDSNSFTSKPITGGPSGQTYGIFEEGSDVVGSADSVNHHRKSAVDEICVASGEDTELCHDGQGLDVDKPAIEGEPDVAAFVSQESAADASVGVVTQPLNLFIGKSDSDASTLAEPAVAAATTAPSASTKRETGKKVKDKDRVSRSSAEPQEAGGVQGRRFVRDARAVAEKGELSSEQKVKELLSAVLQQGVWARGLEKELHGCQQKLVQAQRERDAAVAEAGRASMLRTKLEALCRELQAQNKTIMAESRRLAEDEQRTRQELSDHFLTSIKDVERRLKEQGDGQLELVTQNKTLLEQLQKANAEAALREKEWEYEVRKFAVEQKIAEVKLQQQEQQTKQERLQREAVLEQLRAQQKEQASLQQQMVEYAARFQECQDMMARSNQVMSSFKDERTKMLSRSEKAEREIAELRQKCSKSDAALVQLLEERNELKRQLATAVAQKGKLESLCRTLQEERRQRMAGAAVEAATQTSVVAAAEEVGNGGSPAQGGEQAGGSA